MGKEDSRGTEMGNKNEEVLDKQSPFCTPTGSPAGFPGQARGVQELEVLLVDREP